jgi:fructose-1,6-bisphosphatase I
MSSSVIKDDQRIPAELRPLMGVLAGCGVELARRIAKGEVDNGHSVELGSNSDGDQQKPLDVIADELFASALVGAGVRWYASEEREEVIEMDQGGAYGLAIDPLDGSSNIDVNVSIGTIFSIMPALDDGEASFLRKASDQIAGGYIIYGPQTAMMVTFGDGVLHFVMDPDTHQFVLRTDGVKIPATSTEFAINASNYRHWSRPIRAYIDDCVAGSEGPRSKNFNMRWVASLVAETHRIMMRGGIFLYPSDARPGYENGRLRMVYECAPIAFLVEQASGHATDGHDAILSKSASELHARVPLIFGSAEKVDRVASYFDLPDEEVSALFGKRGLFRA